VVTLLILVVVWGTLGYWIIGRVEGHHWRAFDCLYMTIITLTTVGYGEALDLSRSTAGRVYTIVLLLIGCGIVLYCFSTITAFFVEGNLSEIFWRRKMERAIDALQHHYIVCGAGETGIHVVEELYRTQRPFVVVERDPERVEALQQRREVLVCEGDAEDSKTLLAAGIKRARGLVAALPEDKDNIFVVITARQLNPNLRIIAKGILPESREKLLRAGADAVVSPNFIGGLRLASELIRPRVVSFLDTMLRDRARVIRVEEVTLPSGSPLAGKKIRDSRIYERTGLLVVAMQYEGEETFIYNPGPEAELRPGCTLIVLGEMNQVQRLRELAGAVT